MPKELPIACIEDRRLNRAVFRYRLVLSVFSYKSIRQRAGETLETVHLIHVKTAE